MYDVMERDVNEGLVDSARILNNAIDKGYITNLRGDVAAHRTT